MTSDQPCADCARLKLPLDKPTRFCPIDGAWRCRAHRGAQLERAGVGAPVKAPPASVGRQGSFL